ncbi:MAG: mechanosensitive ion channel protein MscS [Acidobacteria bacterium]|nr:MAG: mechanosensitive ion channel protein MscS [Acidobacteriota bacterium]
MTIPPNWPLVTLALGLALLLSYLFAEFVSRLAQSVLHAIIEDRDVQKQFVDRPRRVVQFLVFLVAAATLVPPSLTLAGYRMTFGGNPDALLRWLLGAGLRIVIIAIAAYFVVRTGSAATRRFEREMSRGTGLNVVERTKRAQTLGRLLQKALSVLVVAIAGLMILRELSVDITPALTGAGIAGLAIGFGAQTIVRDVISGFFLILEDQCRVGDVAVVNGQGGLVEEVNLRTIVLRDEEGTVHVFPNGEVKTLANKSKDFSYYVITFAVGYDDDPGRVIAAMRDASAAVESDPEFKPHILAPLEVSGIDSFDEAKMVIKARIKTVPLKQWLVGRELRRRMVGVFAERGIAPPTGRMIVTLEKNES